MTTIITTERRSNLLFQGVCECGEFLLQQEVLEPTLLLHFMYGSGEPCVEVIPLLLDLYTMWRESSQAGCGELDGSDLSEALFQDLVFPA